MPRRSPTPSVSADLRHTVQFPAPVVPDDADDGDASIVHTIAAQSAARNFLAVAHPRDSAAARQIHVVLATTDRAIWGGRSQLRTLKCARIQTQVMGA